MSKQNKKGQPRQAALHRQTEAKPVRTSEHIEAESPAQPVKTLNEPLFRKIFWGVSFLLLVVMPFLSFDYGITGDERFYKPYGEAALNFYLTGGKDTTALSLDFGEGGKIYSYGAFFDVLSTAVNKYVGFTDPYKTRHFFNSIFGWMIFVFCGLIAGRIAGWRAALFGLLFALLSPRLFGESMNNPRDPLFAQGYVFSIYFILVFLDQLPKPSWKTVMWLMAGLGLAICARVGGLVLFGYLGLFLIWQIYSLPAVKKAIFDNTDNFRQLALKVGAACLGGYVLALLFWPYGLVSPIGHPLEALQFFTNNPYKIKTLFEGQKIWSSDIPWYYVPKWIGMTAPLHVLIGFGLFAGAFTLFRKQINFRFGLMVLFTVLFPMVYAMYKGTSFYNGYRHMIFVYPPIAALAAVGFEGLLKYRKDKPFHIAVVSVMVILLLMPLYWMVRNHPNQYVYFNPMVAGVNGAYGRYETDYFGNSLKQAIDWLDKHEDLNKPVTVAVNFTPFVLENYYKNKNVTFAYVRYPERMNMKYDYAFFMTQLMDNSVYKNKEAFPPKGSIHVIKADDTPLCAIVKKTDTTDYAGAMAIKNNDFPAAINYLSKAVQDDPQNEQAQYFLAYAYANMNQLEPALAAVKQSLKIAPDNLSALNLQGILQVNSGQVDDAIQTFQRIIKENPGFPDAYKFLSACYQRKGNQVMADQYMSYYRQLGGK